MKKFTIFIMMLVMCATTTFAQTAITSPDEVKPGKIYWFQSGWLTAHGNRCSLYYPSGSDAEADKQLLWSAYVWNVDDNFEDPNQQYAFVEYEGKFYLYSVGADKFVTRKNDGAWLVEIPNSFVAITNNTFGNADYPWNIQFDAAHNMANYPYQGYEYCGYVFINSGIEDGYETAAWQIFEVSDLANADELTARLAEAMTEGKRLQEEACDNLMYKVEEADVFLSNINYTTDGGGKVELQVSDPAAGNYIWCNEPELSEGPIENLIDDDTNTFFHSRWNGPVEPVHWLQIDLETEIQNFSFSYHTRVFAGGNDFPDAIEVQGSNDGDSFETIAVLDNDLPQQSDKSWESGNIYAKKAYNHLRFVVTVERTYFHMSEFDLYETAEVSVDEAYQPYQEYLTELVELVATARTFWEENTDATTEELNAYIEQIDELMNFIKGLASGEPDEKTKEYITVVEEVLALQGVGYPGEAPRAAYQALVDAAKANPTTQARLDLEKEMANYIKTEDITLPTEGKRYTLSFVAYNGRRNFLNYEPFDDDSYALSMVRDTLTEKGLPLPETAVFTCIDNGDGTYDFMTADGKYLTTPNGESGSATGISEYPTYFTIVKMYPNNKCEADVTYDDLFGLVALSNVGTYMAPNSSGSYFYTSSQPYFMSSWTSAMSIEAYNEDAINDKAREELIDAKNRLKKLLEGIEGNDVIASAKELVNEVQAGIGGYTAAELNEMTTRVNDTYNSVINSTNVRIAGENTFNITKKIHTVPFEMENAISNFTGFQCNVYLPYGFSIATNEYGDYDLTLNRERISSSHTITARKQDDGSYIIVCYSSNNTKITGNDGALFYINIEVDENVGEGDYLIYADKFLLSTVNAKEFEASVEYKYINLIMSKPADANGDGSITISDVVLTVNALLGNISDKFVFSAGDMNGDGEITISDVVNVVNALLNYKEQKSAPIRVASRYSVDTDELHVSDASINGNEATMTVKLDNADRYNAMQFDLNVPDGVSIKNVTMNSNHTVAYNDCRIVAYSLKNRAFGAQEDIMSITLNVEDKVEYAEVTLDNILVTTTELDEQRLNAVGARIDGTTGIVDNVESTTRIYTESNCIVIETANDDVAEIVTANGIVNKTVITAGKNCIAIEHKGLYVVKVGNKAAKVVF